MTGICTCSVKEPWLFGKKRFVFLGESIHGVAEFTRFRQAIAQCYFSENGALIFEADSSGMLLSHQRNEYAPCRLKNFPKVMRTREMLHLLTWAIDHHLPCLGIDCIPRRDLTDFPREWQSQRQRELMHYQQVINTPDYFRWRDARMAESLFTIARDYAHRRILVMLHNLHIKRCGHQEKGALRLKSVREYVEDLLPLQSRSVAQFARAGNAIHNDLNPFSFEIYDPLSLETYPGIAGCSLFRESQIPDNRVAWHHAFERETLPAKKQYEGCVVFSYVHPPVLV